jgi:class 3 adenylate cyclase
MRFCGQCAAPLAAVCPSCGSANPPGNRFCGQCATPLGGSREPRFAAPDAYTPKHLAERIINSKAALEGERKQVTVLFADLKGSMELLADRDPEEARKILDPVLELMMEAVHRYEGTVNQVMGDGIMALFGAPLALEGHAVRGCYAGLAMQELIARYADILRRTHGADVHIRVGLNSGEVVVRSIGSDLRMDYSAVGQTTNLAARMEQTAAPGTIVISAQTRAAAEGYVKVRSLGMRTVKGVAQPIELFQLLGTAGSRTRLQVAVTRGLTRFVGRQAELAALPEALARAATSRGQIVALVGDVGLGKSRLFWEFTHSPHTAGWLVLESRSVSYGKATTYLPVIELLKSYFHVDDRDGADATRQSVSRTLQVLDPGLKRALAPILALLSVPVDDTEWQVIDPAQRRLRTLEAVRHVLVRQSQAQPLLLVFEDLHWLDSESQAVLDVLVESLPAARILLLVNYRPEYEHRWGGRTHYTQIQLRPSPPRTPRSCSTPCSARGPG